MEGQESEMYFKFIWPFVEECIILSDRDGCSLLNFCAFALKDPELGSKISSFLMKQSLLLSL